MNTNFNLQPDNIKGLAADALIGLALSLILIFPSAWWHGYVASTIWAWFVVPTFGLPTIGVFTAAGLSLLLSLPLLAIINKLAKMPTKPDEEKSVIVRVLVSYATAAVGAAILLFTGWVYHLFGG